MLFFFTPVPICGWTLLSVFPSRVIYERIYALLWLLLGCTVGGAVALVLLTSAILKRTGKPLGELATAALKIGRGNFRAPLPQYLPDDEIGRLPHSIESMQQELQNRIEQLARNIGMREKIESELKIAQSIQQNILPIFRPPLPDCHEFTLAAQLTPARIVSGDLYDAFMLDERQIVLIIGDVSGKGISASLMMAETQTFQWCEFVHNGDPGSVATLLNDMLEKNNPNVMYVTYFACIVDLATGEIRYVNAGHHAPMLVHPDGTVTTLPETHGLPLGMMTGCYDSSVIHMAPGDLLFAWTDGLNEAMNRRNEEYGVARLQKELAAGNADSPAALLNRVTRSVQRFTDGLELTDDMTLLCFKLKNLK